MKAQVQSWAFLLGNYIYSHIFHGKIHTYILTHIPFFTDHLKTFIRKLHNLRKKFHLVPILVLFLGFQDFLIYFTKIFQRYLAHESPLKMMKSTFYFMLKAFFILKMFQFLF